MKCRNENVTGLRQLREITVENVTGDKKEQNK